jgi:hypothetical protein
MSTVLINTDGGSTFQEGTDIINTGQLGVSSKDNFLTKLGISLNDTDKRPLLKPTKKVIDVVNDFSWYAGPKATTAALNKVPCVFLQEREQLLSSLISGAMYYLNAANKGISDVLQSEAVGSLLGSITSEKDAKSIQDSVQGTFESLNTVLGGTAADKELLKQHNLNSLAGIYFTRPTDFHYRLPMYSSPDSVLSQGYDEGGDGILQSVIAGGQEIVQNIADTVNFSQPGTYIEKPNYFQGVGFRSEEVTFPLSNTIRRGTVSPIQQNYELLWLLAFQNKPYRTSFSRTPPPKIYSVTCPGQFSMPYAFIESMDVEFQGTVRKTSVTVPSGNGEGAIGSKVVQTNVPEAYQVTIKFKSLVGEYGNTMISDAFNTSINNNIVRIGK